MSAANVSFPTAPVGILEKIEVWKEVYKVPERVEEHVVTHFTDRILSDLVLPKNIEEFRTKLNQFVSVMPVDYKKAEWRWWWHKIYEHLNSQPVPILEDVWGLIHPRIDLVAECDLEQTFNF